MRGEEVERVHPGEEDSRENLLDSLLLEVKVITSNDGGVDEEEPGARANEEGRA